MAENRSLTTMLSFRVPHETKEWLDKLSAAAGLPTSMIVRNCITSSLYPEDRNSRTVVRILRKVAQGKDGSEVGE